MYNLVKLFQNSENILRIDYIAIGCKKKKKVIPLILSQILNFFMRSRKYSL